MNKKIYLLIAVITAFAICFGAVSANADSGKNLIVYFTMPETDGTDTDAGASRVIVDSKLYGNMQFMADVIHKTAGGDKFEIKTVQEYPMPHSNLIAFARNELNNNIKPELSTHIENIADYDTIFIGYPIWWGDMPMPLYSFFDEYDFSGKTIIPFSSHGGSSLAGTVNKIKNLEPNAIVEENTFYVSRTNIAGNPKSVEENILKWLIDDIRISENTTELTTEITTNEYIPIYGDADANGILTAADAATLLNKVLNMDYITKIEELGYSAVKFLDVTLDGKLTATDATCILQKALDSSFKMPCDNEDRRENK